jgi:hypothetical protein
MSYLIQIKQILQPFYSWIAFAEFIIVIGLLSYIRNRRFNPTIDFQTKKQKIKDLQRAPIDMKNIMDNITHSKALYKILSRQCHPDRFTDELTKKKAGEIFQEISHNRNNYLKLLELQKQAEINLQIQF